MGRILTRAVAGVVLLLLVPCAALAGEADSSGTSERARALFQELRCMVCQNEPIATSNAELARDMRTVVRERIAAGDSNAEIKAYLTRRYGDYVLLDPPVKPSTYALWYGPAVVLVLGAAGVAVYFLRARRAAAPADGLSESERARLDRLLAEADEPSSGPSRDEREP